MRLLGVSLVFAMLAGAALLNRTAPVMPPRAGQLPRPELPAQPVYPSTGDAAPSPVENSTATAPAPERPAAPAEPMAGVARPAKHDPWRHLVDHVALTDDQKSMLQPIVAEREQLLKQAYLETIQAGRSQAEAADAVRAVFSVFDRKILEQLAAEQQYRYNEALMAGTIGRPMLVLTHSSE